MHRGMAKCFLQDDQQGGLGCTVFFDDGVNQGFFICVRPRFFLDYGHPIGVKEMTFLANAVFLIMFVPEVLSVNI